ncbi:MFS transporter [Herbaspirillum sp. NPDC087042]|uniref:MFS transporter n=1 Tax=Herbaspirillum sp. NPDC087042 TaxID=3364004 RepID=UPI00382D4EBA
MDSTPISAPPATPSNAPLYWMALGTFAIGTEGFMIAGMLPTVAHDLGVSAAVAGQLVVAFTAAYAISSPILTALTGAINRRRLLIGTMSLFALANLLAWQAPGYTALLLARILLAMAAGLYVPNAMALAGALVAPERRGGALAIVSGGLTVAVALGAPLGVLIADRLDWRMTFAGVALLAALATLGLMRGLPPGIGAHLPVASLRERLHAARNGRVLQGLLTTLLWATGAYTMYTYFAIYLNEVAGIHGAHVGYGLLLWGVSAAVGVMTGGRLSDRLGFARVSAPALWFMMASFVALSAVAYTLAPAHAVAPVYLAMIVWGVSAWAFHPAQQARLMNIAGLKLASIVLSLNASFMYLGFSLGAAVGALTVATGSVREVGFVAAAFVAGALWLLRGALRKEVPQAVTA